MKLRNKVKEFIDSRGISVYQFRKTTGIANKTAYDLCNHPEQYPNRNVMQAICQAYGVQPGDLLVYLPDADSPQALAGDDTGPAVEPDADTRTGDVVEAKPKRVRKPKGDS